jgi:hypothetical protein
MTTRLPNPDRQHLCETACFALVGQAVPPANHRSRRLFRQTRQGGDAHA